MAAHEMIADDLLAPAASADPHRVLATLREQDPVHWSATHRAWLVTRYDDVAAALGNKALSSDRVRPLLEARKSHDASASDRIRELLSEWMVVTDPPAHTRLRRLAGRAFKQQQISAMGERIERLVDSLLDEFVAGGHTDLIAHVAYPLPATVIAEMLGAPAGDRDRFRHWSDELALVAFGTGGQARPDRHERALRGLEELFDYLRSLVELRRTQPGDDMLSAMMVDDSSGEMLTEDELVGMCALLLFAGHETTTNSIANGVLALLEHPEQLALLRREPETITTAVEELLRFDGPIKVLNRWVVEDFDLRGRSIRSGERVYLVIAAANRDPARFAEPDRPDLSRNPNPHIAFGRGIHACIGAQLARLETRIALAEVVERLPGLRLDDGRPEWKASLASRSLTELTVAHDAAR
ncbi:MAG: cytochrome P450 [Pseudonocardiaceae bacterium]|nr:cytochrome P450 [Pseudonocardiaceae bacterium]